MAAPITVVQPTIEVPEPGIYPDVPAEVYHRWPAASQTVLKIMRDRSPAHARQYMLTPPEPTPAMVLGQAIHAAILQPDLFREHYVRGLEFDRRTKQGREAWEALAAEHPNAIILKPEDYDRCIAIRDAVHSHHYARKLLRGQTEVSAVWRDPWFGVLCKGRFDCVPTGLGIIVDVKSVSDASPRAMQRFIYAYGTYLQAAHYMIGAKQVRAHSRRERAALRHRHLQHPRRRADGRRGRACEASADVERVRDGGPVAGLLRTGGGRDASQLGVQPD